MSTVNSIPDIARRLRQTNNSPSYCFSHLHSYNLAITGLQQRFLMQHSPCNLIIAVADPSNQGLINIGGPEVNGVIGVPLFAGAIIEFVVPMPDEPNFISRIFGRKQQQDRISVISLYDLFAFGTFAGDILRITYTQWEY